MFAAKRSEKGGKDELIFSPIYMIGWERSMGRDLISNQCQVLLSFRTSDSSFCIETVFALEVTAGLKQKSWVMLVVCWNLKRTNWTHLFLTPSLFTGSLKSVMKGEFAAWKLSSTTNYLPQLLPQPKARC